MSAVSLYPDGNAYTYRACAVERVRTSHHYLVTIYTGDNQLSANHVVDDFGDLVRVESWS